VQPLDYVKLGFQCGLEIHQQLATSKLFCRCSTADAPAEPGPPEFTLRRRLRPTQSEMGEVDAAALAEARRKRFFEYHGYHGRACLVEADEEPPHPASEEAVDVSLTMSLLLHSRPVDEVQWMRKIVIDGSNTSGFQRTGLVALGGAVDDVAIQTLALEEDSCQRIKEGQDHVVFGLDRLGIPLIEIATAPTIRDGVHARQIAARLGAFLRQTGRVKRGLGTIRQDLNVSVRGGSRIEVKGVQDLNSIPKVIEWEVRRQLRLLEVADKLRERGVQAKELSQPVVDLRATLARSESTVVKRILASGGVVVGVRMPGFHGLIGAQSKELPRLGRELSSYAKRESGVGGILHGDELPGMGITEAEVAAVRNDLGCRPDDSFVLVADSEKKAKLALTAVLERAATALRGVPEEVRAAEADDTTTYLRPLPGAARMYPETDIPPVAVSPVRLKRLEASLPPLPEQEIASIQSRFGLGKEEATQIFEKGFTERLAEWSALSSPSIASRALLQMLPQAQAKHPEVPGLDEILRDLLRSSQERKLPREAVEKILSESLDRVAKNLQGNPGLRAHANERGGTTYTMAMQEVRTLVDEASKAVAEPDALQRRAREIVSERADFVRQRGLESVGPLMGILMKEFRGKVEGGQVSQALQVEVERLLRK
jgi:glutamyl-tRNA(Gln) amidotransferase subunit E